MESSHGAKSKQMLTGSPSKLNDGSWGVRVNGHPNEGDTVEVRTRSGKTWQATVEAVLWSGKDRSSGDPIALCQTVSDRKKASSTGSGSTQSANPLVAAGRDVARLASRLANQHNEGNQKLLMDAIRTLCGHAELRVEFYGRDLDQGRATVSTPPPSDDDIPPFDDDDVPF